MADFQTLLDNVAQVVGGTAPDLTSRPRWFSGSQVGDGTGLVPGGSYPTFKGCHSSPPELIEDFPIGIVLPGPFTVGGPRTPDVYVQGVEQNIDDLRLMILVARIDSETDYANLAPYRDIVPAAFAAKMTAFSTANTLQIMVRAGKPITLDWAGAKFGGLEFTIRAIRLVSRTYTA